MVLTVSFALSPVSMTFESPSPARRVAPVRADIASFADLTPAWGRQDHTTSPSARVRHVKPLAPRPSHSNPTFVTPRPPLMRDGTKREHKYESGMSQGGSKATHWIFATPILDAKEFSFAFPLDQCRRCDRVRRLAPLRPIHASRSRPRQSSSPDACEARRPEIHNQRLRGAPECRVGEFAFTR
jgi:hypothetical protein